MEWGAVVRFLMISSQPLRMPAIRVQHRQGADLFEQIPGPLAE